MPVPNPAAARRPRGGAEYIRAACDSGTIRQNMVQEFAPFGFFVKKHSNIYPWDVTADHGPCPGVKDNPRHDGQDGSAPGDRRIRVWATMPSELVRGRGMRAGHGAVGRASKRQCSFSISSTGWQAAKRGASGVRGGGGGDG